jgi:hypothetical protein
MSSPDKKNPTAPTAPTAPTSPTKVTDDVKDKKETPITQTLKAAKADAAIAAAKAPGNTEDSFIKNLFQTVQGVKYDDRCPHGLPYYACMSCSH